MTDDCQATAPASCPRVKPSVFSSAKSRRRRRIDAIRVSPRPGHRAGGQPPARTSGIAPIDL